MQSPFPAYRCLPICWFGNGAQRTVILVCRHLSGEIGTEYHKRKETAGSVDDLMALVTKIVPFDFTHNSEPQACDLLLEVCAVKKNFGWDILTRACKLASFFQVERLPHVVAHCTSDNHRRVCDYLLSYADYVASPGNREIQKVSL